MVAPVCWRACAAKASGSQYAVQFVFQVQALELQLLDIFISGRFDLRFNQVQLFADPVVFGGEARKVRICILQFVDAVAVFGEFVGKIVLGF